MDEKEFFDEIKLRLGCSGSAGFEKRDFEDVRRPSPCPLDVSLVAAVCKRFGEWHWRMFAYRLFFKVSVEQYLQVVVDLINAESNENCRDYLLQILEVRATKSHAAKIFEVVRSMLVSIQPSVGRSLLLAKLLRNVDDKVLAAIAMADISSGKCKYAALRAYQRVNRSDIQSALAPIQVEPRRRA